MDDGATMPNVYRAYVLNDDDRITSPPRVLDSADDKAALDAAYAFLSEGSVEVWCGDRWVGTIKRTVAHPGETGRARPQVE